MERFSLELEATEVFYGKNQSCRACRETHRTGGNYANYDAMHIYAHPLGEALGRERTSTSASEWVSPTSEFDPPGRRRPRRD